MNARKILSSCLFIGLLSSSFSSFAGVEKNDKTVLENYKFLLTNLPAGTATNIEAEISRFEKSSDLDHQKIASVLEIWQAKVNQTLKFRIEEDESGLSDEYCGNCYERLSCAAPSGTVGGIAGTGAGALLGAGTGLVGGAMTGVGQSMSETFNWDLIWIVGGSVGGTTLVVCTTMGAIVGGLVGIWKGPAIWKSMRSYFSKKSDSYTPLQTQDAPFTYEQIIEELELEKLSFETNKNFKLIYDNLIKDLPVESV
jgi:hypothetical protein